MKSRIQTILNQEGLSSSKFADLIGVQRSSISHILTGRNKPSLDLIQKILVTFPDLSSDWLISGLGEMYKNENKHPKLVFDLDDNEEDQKEQNIINEDSRESEPKPINSSPFIPNSTKIGEKRIERVVVFFTDQTFSEYTPS
ncbi:MAG: helix-turn-helix domain-containing protein [Marinifilaceae bacterium]|jgi:transcriptional regulator with XRE-family HTH domain|nr:helix-turn-helix domain-containing protein [Marinifilaceae bacterium]